MKTIKVIDILSKMAYEKEFPKKIKHCNEVYLLNTKYEGFIIYESKGGKCLDLIQCLNDEVEIIEENEDINIQDIGELNEFVHIGYDEGEDIKDPTSVKINELIKAVKELDRRIK